MSFIIHLTKKKVKYKNGDAGWIRRKAWQMVAARQFQKTLSDPHLRTAAPSLLAHFHQGLHCFHSPVPTSSGPHAGQLEEESSGRLLLKVNGHD